jgi:AbrB family looped-hinge helix DNA binding protein
MEFDITKISSKGQVVIPQGIRDKLSLRDGQILAVSTEDNLIVLKKVDNNLEKEELKIFNNIKGAWREIEAGKCRKVSKEEFLKNIKEW